MAACSKRSRNRAHARIERLCWALRAPERGLKRLGYFYGRIELSVGLYFGGYDIYAPFGVMDLLWSKFARERVGNFSAKE